MEGNNHDRLFAHSKGNLSITPRRTVACAIALDENGEYAYGATLNDEVNGQPRYFSSPDALLSSFVVGRYRTCELLLHGADRAMRYFLPQLERMIGDGYEAVFCCNAQGHIINVRITHHRNSWYVRDTFALIPQPLEELCKLANYTGTYTPLPLDPYSLDGPDLDQLLARDCRLILRAYRAVVDTLAKTFGVRPALTAGSTAIRAWLTTIPEGHVHYRNRPPVERFVREAYYGALNFLTTQEQQHNVAYIDVNAMYAHAMRQGVPVMGAIQTKQEHPGNPGVYECIVTPPHDLFIPFVPHRLEDFPATVYPSSGTFHSVLPSNTIELARQFGYSIEVGRGYFWDRLEDIFNPFVDRCEELELQYKERGARSVIKSLRNSLYGKFGQKDRGKEYYLTSTPDDDMTPEIDGFDGMPVGNLYYRNIHISRPHMMVHWAAWITATARNMLTRAAYALGDSVYYGDNDSLMLDADKLDGIPLGDKYGEWKLVRHYTSLSISGKKRYMGVTEQGEIVEHDIKWAGIPRGTLTPDVVEKITPGGPPVESPEYLTNHRAIDTTNNRPKVERTSQTIIIPKYHEDIPAYRQLYE